MELTHNHPSYETHRDCKACIEHLRGIRYKMGDVTEYSDYHQLGTGETIRLQMRREADIARDKRNRQTEIFLKWMCVIYGGICVAYIIGLGAANAMC